MSVEVVTFGCRLNTAESEVIRREAERAGFDDTVVVNTCAVTAEAVRQAKQTIRALHRARPQAKIVVTGCAAQTEPQTFVAMAEADRVIGNAEKLSAAAWSQAHAAFDIADAPKTAVNDIMSVKQILKHVPDLKRLRLSSIDSVEADRDLIDAFAAHERLMPHLHLSLQAGDDLILKRMKRRHTRADAIVFCDGLRRLRPDMVFGADIIAGFPTETEDMFRRSLDLVEDCGLTHLHVFPFSARPGTPASRMPQLARALVKERARRLRARGAMALRGHLAAEVGARRRVLAESEAQGRTEQFTQVKFAAPAASGAIVDVQIAAHDGRQLIAA